MKSVQPTARVTVAMRRRAAAAIQLVKAGVIDGDLALSYVIWPPQSIRERQEKAA